MQPLVEVAELREADGADQREGGARHQQRGDEPVRASSVASCGPSVDDVAAHQVLGQRHGADEARAARSAAPPRSRRLVEPHAEHHQQRQRVDVQRVERQDPVEHVRAAQQAPAASSMASASISDRQVRGGDDHGKISRRRRLVALLDRRDQRGRVVHVQRVHQQAAPVVGQVGRQRARRQRHDGRERRDGERVAQVQRHPDEGRLERRLRAEDAPRHLQVRDHDVAEHASSSRSSVAGRAQPGQVRPEAAESGGQQQAEPAASSRWAGSAVLLSSSQVTTSTADSIGRGSSGQQRRSSAASRRTTAAAPAPARAPRRRTRRASSSCRAARGRVAEQRPGAAPQGQPAASSSERGQLLARGAGGSRPRRPCRAVRRLPEQRAARPAPAPAHQQRGAQDHGHRRRPPIRGCAPSASTASSSIALATKPASGGRPAMASAATTNSAAECARRAGPARRRRAIGAAAALREQPGDGRNRQRGAEGAVHQVEQSGGQDPGAADGRPRSSVPAEPMTS